MESTSYTYKLEAANATGAGVASSDLVATTAPAAPTGVGALSVTTTSLTLTWTDHSAGEDGFVVERSSDNGVSWQNAGTSAMLSGTGSGGSLSQSGLTEGTDYVYRVHATLGDLESADSSTFNVTTLPSAPTGLAVGAITDGSVALSWTDASGGETGYVVERSDDAGTSWSDLTTLGVGATSHVDSTVAEGASYSYRVHAVRNGVSSALSGAVSADTLPATPTGLSASASDPTTVVLTWTDASTTEDGYLIERSADGGQSWSQINTVAADVATYTDTAAPESATSSYRVRATKGLLESADSNVATATTPVAVPTAVVASATSHNAITITWTDHSGVETAQRIERSNNGGATWSTVTEVGTNVATYGDTGLSEDTTYRYRIVAVVGQAESTPSTASTGVKTPLAAPTGLQASSPTATSVALTWTNASAAAANVVIERSDDNGSNWSTVTTVAGSATTYADNMVSEGTAYQYRIGATKSGNASAVTSPATLSTLPAGPSGLGLTVFSASQIDLAWTDHAASESGYKVFRADNGGAYNEIANLPADAASFSDTHTHEGGTFGYLVYAYGTGGDSAQATSTAVTAPADPTVFTSTPMTATRVDLAWTDNSGGETNYVVERSGNGGASWTALVTLAPDVHAYSDTTALEAHSYSYRVKAVRSSAASAWATTAATTVPATPTALTAVIPAGPAKVNLSWTDNSAGENGFQIERSVDGGASWSLVTSPAANATTYSDTTVEEGVTYVFRLRATSAAGNSDWSATATASTLPAAPTSLAASAFSPTQVNLTWTDNSSHETGFILERSVGGVTWSTVATPAANAASYSDTSVSEAVTYQYRVRAVTAAVNGNASGSVSVSTPLSAPTGITATAISTTQVNLAWTDTSAVESSYKVERSTDGGTTFTPLTTLVANSSTYSDTTTAAGTTYVYRVRAAKSAIYSSYATAAAVTTAPTAPGTVTATAASNSQVNLSWADAQGETAYTVERSSNGGTSWTALSSAVAANATSYADSTATEETAYLYRVKSTNAAGASAYVTSGSVTTLPTAPGALQANTESTDTISLTWADHSLAETGFKIERQVLGSNSWQQIATVGANVTSYVDPTCDESVEYEYRIRATSGARNSVYSNTTSAATLPVAPSDLTVVATDSSSVQLAWTNTSAAPTMMVERSIDGGETFVAIDTTGLGGTSYTNTGLASGTTYVYRIRGYNGSGGYSDPTNTVIATTA